MILIGVLDVNYEMILRQGLSFSPAGFKNDLRSEQE
jgi:hypothetical protein